MALEWMRAKKDETELSKRRTWESRCRQYKVQECAGKFAEMGTVVYAIANDGPRIISRHIRRSAAEKACEKFERRRLKELATPKRKPRVYICKCELCEEFGQGECDE